MSVLMIALVLSPIAVAALVHAYGSSRPVVRGSWLFAVALALSSSMAGTAISAATVVVGRTPWNSTLALELKSPVSWLVAAVYWAYVAAHYGPTWRHYADGPHRALAVSWCLCSAICASLLVNDLLTRVVVLDIASLLVALLLLSRTPGSPQPSAIRHYCTLRLGDMAFLLVALLLAHETGTMSISSAFAAAPDLQGTQRLLLFGAGLVTVWVKLGLEPATGWLRAASRLPEPQRSILTSAGPPLLGAYLLYRLQPAIAAMPRPSVFVLLVTCLGAAAILIESRRRNMTFALQWLSLHSLLALPLCLTQQLRLYLLTFVPIRIAICLVLPLPRDLGVRSDPAGDIVTVKGIRAMAQLADTFEALTTSLAHALYVGLRQASARLQAAHAGKLRRSLTWAVFGLLAILSAFLATGMRTSP